MTWHLTLLLPAALCALSGYAFANWSLIDAEDAHVVPAAKSGVMSLLFWAGAAVSLLGALQ